MYKLAHIAYGFNPGSKLTGNIVEGERVWGSPFALTKAEVKPSVRFSSTNDNAIISMVANHLGISILPNLITQKETDSITAIPLNPYVYRTLGIGIKSIANISPVSKKFIQYVKKVYLHSI